LRCWNLRVHLLSSKDIGEHILQGRRQPVSEVAERFGLLIVVEVAVDKSHNAVPRRRSYVVAYPVSGIEDFIFQSLVFEGPVFLSFVEFVHGRVEVDWTVERSRNGELGFEPSEESLNLSKRLLGPSLKHLVNTAVRSIVLRESEFGFWFD
jgi:hypothetical protein